MVEVTAWHADRRDFVATVTNIDLTGPVSDQEISQVAGAIARFGVLVFPNQDIDDEALMRFSRNFGDPERSTRSSARGTPADRDLIDEFTNLDATGQRLDRMDPSQWRIWYNLLWHSDGSYKKEPIQFSFLAGKIIPATGGNTEFADMRAAFDALDDGTKAELRLLEAEHSVRATHDALGFEPDDFTMEALVATGHFGSVVHPLVRRHESGREALFLSSHAHRIAGVPLVEGRMRLLDLKEHATASRFTYSHVWREKDLLMWDNSLTMHRARPYDNRELRKMHRTAVTRLGAQA